MLTLFDLARSLTSNMTVQDAADLIAKHLRRLIPSSACVFYIYDEDTDELIAAQTSGEHAALIKGLRIPRGQRLSGWVAANRQTIRNSDPVLDLGESARAMSPRPRSCLSTPLLSGKTLVGVLSLYSSNKEAFGEDHERILEVVARQVSSAIADAHNTERHRSRSLRDQSTGLPNLRHLMEFTETQVPRADARHPFCILVVRLSSEVIVDEEIAESAVPVLRRVLRTTDLLFRTADDELVIVLLNTDRSAAMTMGSKVNATVGAHLREHFSTKLRVGFACAPDDASTSEQLVRVARERAANGSNQLLELPPESIH